MDDPTEKQILNEPSNLVVDQKEQFVEENNDVNLMGECGMENVCDQNLKPLDEPFCQFIVGPGKKEFMGNKMQLSLQSSVFKDMFYDPSKKSDVIEIPDVEPDIFDFLLKFIADELSVCLTNVNHAINVLHLADKFCVIDLKRLIAEYLYPNNVDTVFIALNYGVLYSIPLLIEGAMKIVREEAVDVLESTQFSTIDHAALMLILKDEYLNVLSELTVLHATISWGKYQCMSADIEPNLENIRKRLGEAVHHIRFLTLTPKEIKTSCDFLLTSEETLKIVNVLRGTKDKSTIEPFSTCTEKRKKREIVQGLPVITTIKFAKTPLESSVDLYSTKTLINFPTKVGVELNGTNTALDFFCPVILLSVLLHTVHNKKKSGQFYFESVTLQLYQFKTLIAEGKFTGLVKYNDCFKVPLFSTRDPNIAPIIAHCVTHCIEVIFNTKKAEPNPPYVKIIKCPFLGCIEGGYVIGVEYCLLTPGIHKNEYQPYLTPSFIQRSGYPIRDPSVLADKNT